MILKKSRGGTSSNPDRGTQGRSGGSELVLACSLLFTSLIVFLESSSCGFVNVDDLAYVTSCGFRRRRTLIPEGTRRAFRAEDERFSERSDAGISIVPEVFGFVKKTCPERSGGRAPLARKGVRGKGRPPQLTVGPERDLRSGMER